MPSLVRSLVLCAGLFLFPVLTAKGQEPLLEKKITISKQYTTLYKALNQISENADCLFIYDSQLVEDDKHVKLAANHLPLKLLLDKLLDNPTLTYKVIGRHILIYRQGINATIGKPVITQIKTDSARAFLLKGRVFDSENKNPVPYASIGIEKNNTGTITNTDGYFVLKVPPDCMDAYLLVTHIGYKSQFIPVALIDKQQVDIFLERRIISIQEVIIRYIDPLTIVKRAVEQREVNNCTFPVYLTTFYREGIKKNDQVVSYSEAVFKVYKSPYDLNEEHDQVKMLKSRKVQNSNLADTILLKFKAGILAGLQLDIVKSLPGFLDPEQLQLYAFTYSDLVSYNDQEAYAITFKQIKGVEDPLFAGTLYISNENFAILGADFEVNPDYLDKAVNELVQKKSRRLLVKFEKINYSVSYKNYSGKYYLNHARCDLFMKTRFRNRLAFTRFNTFMEIATCHIDTIGVVRFGKEEVIKPDVVFSDLPYQYDDSFWGDYNYIAPEAKLSEALSRIMPKIEKIE